APSPGTVSSVAGEGAGANGIMQDGGRKRGSPCRNVGGRGYPLRFLLWPLPGTRQGPHFHGRHFRSRSRQGPHTLLGEPGMARGLVVEDDPMVCRLMALALEHAGHQVAEAADGSDALDAQRRRPADLVFCDLFMPGMDGIETIRALKALSPAVV